LALENKHILKSQNLNYFGIEEKGPHTYGYELQPLDQVMTLFDSCVGKFHFGLQMSCGDNKLFSGATKPVQNDKY
jgi:hypothetical protein